MGYQLQKHEMKRLFDCWKEQFLVYGPKRMTGEGMYSDTDVVRYELLSAWEELEWDTKAQFSYKEVLLPITQILFYFTEGEVKEAEIERTKPVLLFMRSCDIHALKRLDEVYLNHKYVDHYYRRLREKIKIVLMGCEKSCESGFCVSMGTNRTGDYDAAVNCGRKAAGEDAKDGMAVELMGDWSRWSGMEELLDSMELQTVEAEPDFVSENRVTVTLPEHCGTGVVRAGVWKEYDSRCIACGRCNFVCPTCTCFTMQDIFYQDNGRVGERRRVHASCMVDGYTDVAGGGSYRKTNGERMRYKVLHKISDFKKKFGYPMCVGCGRCDDVCPEYISFSACVNKLAELEKEVR